MPQPVHVFAVIANFGAEDVFRALSTVCEHPSQRRFEPQFEFDWLKRRIAVSANSEEGLAICHEQFMNQIVKSGGEQESLLAGQPEENEGRWSRPYGVAVMDAATFAEHIGNSLVDVGLRGVQIVDTAEGCMINVRQSAMAKSFDYRAFIMEFPLPGYVTIRDLGNRTRKQ